MPRRYSSGDGENRDRRSRHSASVAGSCFSLPLVRLHPAGSARGLRGQTHTSYPLLLVSGVFLGIAGTTFAVGIPFVSAWGGKPLRGFATGKGGEGTAQAVFFHAALRHLVRLHPDLPGRGRRGGSGRRDQLDDDGGGARWTANRDPVDRSSAAALSLSFTCGDVAPLRGDLRWLRWLAHKACGRTSRLRSHPGRDKRRFALAAVVARAGRRRRSPTRGTTASGGPDLPGGSRGARPRGRHPTGTRAGCRPVRHDECLRSVGMGGVFAWVARRGQAHGVGIVARVVGAAGGGSFPPLVMGATYNEADHGCTTSWCCCASPLPSRWTFVLLRLPRGEAQAS